MPIQKKNSENFLDGLNAILDFTLKAYLDTSHFIFNTNHKLVWQHISELLQKHVNIKNVQDRQKVKK